MSCIVLFSLYDTNFQSQSTRYINRLNKPVFIFPLCIRFLPISRIIYGARCLSLDVGYSLFSERLHVLYLWFLDLGIWWSDFYFGTLSLCLRVRAYVRGLLK